MVQILGDHTARIEERALRFAERYAVLDPV
jgi:hypothetical protein